MALSGERRILALNCGSSSLKFGLYASDGKSARALCEGEAEEVGKNNGSYWFRKPGSDQKDKGEAKFPDHAAAFRHALEGLRKCGAPEPQAVGHRFVHGGPDLTEHAVLTPEIEGKLRAAVDYAPLHLPSSLAVLDAAQKALPGVPEVICFDTAFHRTMPDVSRTLALPEKLRKMGVARYGFHGLSLESIAAQLEPALPPRLVIAHLGNGSSITAVLGGKSIDTSMGMTPAGGVMMGTRCGDLDPGVSVYLMRHGYQDPSRFEELCDRRSGLLGVSGGTSDVRELLSRRGSDQRADLALRMFCYQVRKAVAAMAGALGGLDLLVFTGGIGEHAGEIRTEICSELGFLGITHESKVAVLPAQEDEQIAKNTFRLL